MKSYWSTAQGLSLRIGWNEEMGERARKGRANEQAWEFLIPLSLRRGRRPSLP